MMREKNKIRYFVQILACLCVCGMLGGCEGKDKAMVFPIAETASDVIGCEEKEQPPIEAEEVLIYVYVCGAVEAPGVVGLPEGSRADAALEAAGGFSQDAQRDFVNLAARLEDGQKLYFPTAEEARKQAYTSYLEQAGLVNLNTATEEQLMTLPGIGEARARDIIAYREQYGAFDKKEDLKKVSGIKDSMYQKLADKIVVQ